MQVVVVSSDYADTPVANRVTKKVANAEIILVNPRMEFVERAPQAIHAADNGRAYLAGRSAVALTELAVHSVAFCAVRAGVHSL